MKKIRIYYWIITGLFALFMLISYIPDILSVPAAVEFFKTIQMPAYIIPFIGIAKLLGVIAILIPGYPRIKEWAYAGFVFDLAGALYSNYASGKSTGEWLPILLPIILAFVSYALYHKKMVLTNQ